MSRRSPRKEQPAELQDSSDSHTTSYTSYVPWTPDHPTHFHTHTPAPSSHMHSRPLVYCATKPQALCLLLRDHLVIVYVTADLHTLSHPPRSHDSHSQIHSSPLVSHVTMTSGWTRLVRESVIKVRSDVTLTGSFFGLVN